MLGVVLVDKPLGLTSHDVVSRLRHRFNTRRVGHAGTLDPLATGLLVVAVGPATRFLQYLPLEPKEYMATIRFGIETTTQDAEGEIVAEEAVPSDLESRFHAVVADFTGLITQIPPIYSAVKKDGKPLYSYARKGIDVERKARTVHIGEVEVLQVSESEMAIRLVCSGGTYVRTWAHDIGRALQCGAHLVGLRRTRVGRFNLNCARELDSVSFEHVMPLAEALPPMQLIALEGHQVDEIRNGIAVSITSMAGMDSLTWTEGSPYGLLDQTGQVVAIGRLQSSYLQPECVIPTLE